MEWSLLKPKSGMESMSKSARFLASGIQKTTPISNLVLKLQKHCIANRVNCGFYYPNGPETKHTDMTSFVITHLKK